MTTNNLFRCLVGFIIYLVYRICRLLVDVCDDIANVFFVDKRKSPGYTAKHGRILWKRKHFEMKFASSFDFMCFFISRVKPEYVLRQNVSLYALTNKEAIFVETAKDVDIHSSKVHPFFFVAQFRYARNVIKMSISDFVSLAEKIGDPAVPVILISNTGRCGGTMLCQMFESLPGTLVMQEPDPPLHACILLENGAVNKERYDAMLRSAIRILCKRRPGIQRICIKPRARCMAMMKDIPRLAPNLKHIFMYRNPLNTISSMLRMMYCEPYPAVLYSCAYSNWFSIFFPKFRYLMQYYFIPKPNNFQQVPQGTNSAGVFGYTWAHIILIARAAMSRDSNFQPIKYEDIIANPRGTVKQLFGSFGIDIYYLDGAISSMSRDSQGESVLSQENLRSDRGISTKDKINIDSILIQFNLPLLGADLRI